MNTLAQRALRIYKQQLRSLCWLGIFLSGGNVQAACLGEGPLRGVNLAGAEFNSKALPGVMHKNYTYPKESELDYYASKGVNIIRLPVRWERLQRRLYAPLHSEEVAAIQKTLDSASERDICVLLDLHNYGMYHGEVLGGASLPSRAFTDLWKRVATTFSDPDVIAFGLMNEPFKLNIVTWGKIAKNTLRDLRAAGSEHLILVSGGRWSGVHEWFKTYDGSSNAAIYDDLADPLNRAVIEVHQYTNPSYSGTDEVCLEPTHFSEMFSNISEWARDNNQRLFLGEFGVPATSQCLETLRHMMCLTSSSVWKGWTYWAGGGWWGDYFMSIAPRNGEDAPQMTVLEPFLGGQCMVIPAIIRP